MRKGPYYTEDILVEKMQSGEYGWLDYVNHFSEEWQNEYQEYCKEHALCKSGTNTPSASMAVG